MFTSDGSAKSLLVDEKMTVGYVTRVLAEKNHVKLDPKWALVELVPGEQHNTVSLYHNIEISSIAISQSLNITIYQRL